LNYLKLIAIYTAVIVILHIIPTGPPGGNGIGLSSTYFLFIRADYLLHMLLFIPLMILVWLYLNSERITGVARFNHALLWLVAGIVLASAVEGVQYFLPHRSFNPLDLIFNVAGVITGALVFLWEPKRYARLS